MRSKVFVLIILSVFFALPAQSQLRFGIRGGVNSANFSLTEFTTSDYKIDYASSTQVGFHFGAVGQLKIVSFVLQPEILFSTAKMDVQLTELAGGEPSEDVMKFNKLDVPVIAGFKFGPLKLQAGPVATVMLNSKSDLLERAGIEQAYKGATIGYQAGLGLELSSLLLDVKYEGNLSAFGDGVSIGSETLNFDQRMNQWIISLGFLF